MKIFKLKDKEDIKEIFKGEYFKKNKNKFKIVYNNKIYSSYNDIQIPENEINHSKIKLISLYNYKNDGIFDKFKENYNYKRNNNKYNIYLKSSLHGFSQIAYIINNDKKIRIFGEDFVENNKDKCIIIYKDNILPLRESFLTEDIKKENDEYLIITLIEFEDIIDRSYMFNDCDSLVEFPLSKNVAKYIVNTNKRNGKNNEKSLSNSTISKDHDNNWINEFPTKEKSELSNITTILKEYPSTILLLDKSNWFTCICQTMRYMFS